MGVKVISRKLNIQTFRKYALKEGNNSVTCVSSKLKLCLY